MLGKLAGAFIGEKLAGRNHGPKGALSGAGVAACATRGLGLGAGARRRLGTRNYGASADGARRLSLGRDAFGVPSPIGASIKARPCP